MLVLIPAMALFAGQVTEITMVDMLDGGTNYNVLIIESSVTNTDGKPDTGVLGLISITNENETVPVDVFSQSSVMTIYTASVVVPADALSETYTFTWTNYTYGTNYTESLTLGGAWIATWPQDQSVFVGDTATFSATAYHTSGYQWQKDGTNLVEDGHFIGVTNATLTITNVQLTDAGYYSLIANHPSQPASAEATLSVYKPIILQLTNITNQGGACELWVANQDGSPFEPSRIPNLQVLSATDLSPDTAIWNVETNAGSLSNGVLQFRFSNSVNRAKYWRVMEQ